MPPETVTSRRKPMPICMLQKLIAPRAIVKKYHPEKTYSSERVQRIDPTATQSLAFSRSLYIIKLH